MKIGDVQVGVEYGYETKSRYHRNTPRQVVAQEIVTVEEKTWNNYTGSYDGVRKVRRVKIKFLDEPTDTYGAKKGHVMTVEAKELVGAWADLRGPILERAKQEQEKVAAEQALTRRVRSLLGQKSDWRISMYSYHHRGGELELSGNALEHLLTLAEAGLAARGS